MNTFTSSNAIYNYAGLFKTDLDWIHPDRTETTFEMICVTKGEVYLNDCGKEYCLSKGQCLLMYPGTRHFGYRQSSDVSFYWVHFNASTDDFPIPAGLYTEIENRSLFKELLHLANLPNPPDYAVNAVLVHILSLFLLEHEKNINATSRLSEEIYEFIRINASAKLTCEIVAQRFGFSSDHITRLLKSSFGMGTKELCDKFIMSKAKELLCNTVKYVKEISADLSFSTDKAFVSFFKYHEGISPSAFRNRFNRIHMNNH